jgi:hypothetical protein
MLKTEKFRTFDGEIHRYCPRCDNYLTLGNFYTYKCRGRTLFRHICVDCFKKESNAKYKVLQLDEQKYKKRLKSALETYRAHAAEFNRKKRIRRLNEKNKEDK